ncbi:MAG: response regulator transcription factor [Acetobacteraceae bacterium]|jgi:DNA-binding response OmpR family regulator
MRLLLVEDNARLLTLTRDALARAGFDTDGVTTAADAEAALRSIAYSAVVLDLGLPDQDGLVLLKKLRAAGHTLPILVLTARGGVEDRVRGLDAGADDYLVKPFAQEELQARIRVLLRRPGGLLGQALELGRLRLDTVSREVTIDGAPQSLSPREMTVLEILLRRAGRVVPKHILEDHLFGLSAEVGSNAVEVYVHRLRKQLMEAHAGVEIHTIRGIGYLVSGPIAPPHADEGRHQRLPSGRAAIVLDADPRRHDAAGLPQHDAAALRRHDEEPAQ